MEKYPLYKSALNTLQLALKNEDVQAAEDAIQQLFMAQDKETAQGTSDLEGTYLQFKGMGLAVEYHILKQDLISAAYHFMMMEEYFREMKDHASFAEADIQTIESLVVKTARRLTSVAKEDNDDDAPDAEPETSPQKPKHIGLCQLCKEQEARCVGSHMAPHFLIQSYLSYDGQRKRDTEVVNETTMAGFKKERKWGRAVPGDQIDEVFGKVSDKEKETVRSSSVTRDHLFCNTCEKRFGFVESAYSEFFKQKSACSDGWLAYVFWLGVFWRLSVGNMAVKLSEEDQKRIGDLLHKWMPFDKKDVVHMKADEDTGGYAYSIFHCSDVKGELSGVIGLHNAMSPYRLLVGDFVIVLYKDRSQIEEGVEANFGDKPEQWQEIPFIEYWKKKQQILDANWKWELDYMGDGKEKCVDVIKGDHVEELPSVFGLANEEMKYEDISEGKSYLLKIPGSMQKILLLCENHPEADTAEKRMELIKQELGYTPEEVEEMWSYWNEHVKPMTLRKEGKKVRRAKKKAAIKKQSVKKPSNKKKKNHKKKSKR